MSRRRRRLLFAAVTLVVVVGLGLVLPFWHRAADHFHYALPGRVPARVAYKGREYIYPTPCTSTKEIARKWGPIRRVGTVFGWLTRSRGMYVPVDVRGDSTVMFVTGGRGCLVLYGLSGGP